MPSYTTIALDTTPPNLEIGEPTRPSMDLVEAPYSVSDDGEIVSAELVVLEGSIDMAVLQDKLSVGIPESTLSQTAYVRATARDDVWNPVTVQVPIQIAGREAKISTAIFEYPGIEFSLSENPSLSYEAVQSPRTETSVEELPYIDPHVIIDPESEIDAQ